MCWPGKFTTARAMLHTLMSFGNKNNLEITEHEFMAASAHFGLHNPTPVICKRLANYGNLEDVEKLLEKAYHVQKDNLKEIGVLREDQFRYTGSVPDRSVNIPRSEGFGKNNAERDMNQDSSDNEEDQANYNLAKPPTIKPPQENKRMAATQDMIMLSE